MVEVGDAQRQRARCYRIDGQVARCKGDAVVRADVIAAAVEDDYRALADGQHPCIGVAGSGIDLTARSCCHTVHGGIRKSGSRPVVAADQRARHRHLVLGQHGGSAEINGLVLCGDGDGHRRDVIADGLLPHVLATESHLYLFRANIDIVGRDILRTIVLLLGVGGCRRAISIQRIAAICNGDGALMLLGIVGDVFGRIERHHSRLADVRARPEHCPHRGVGFGHGESVRTGTLGGNIVIVRFHVGANLWRRSRGSLCIVAGLLHDDVVPGDVVAVGGCHPQGHRGALGCRCHCSPAHLGGHCAVCYRSIEVDAIGGLRSSCRDEQQQLEDKHGFDMISAHSVLSDDDFLSVSDVYAVLTGLSVELAALHVVPIVRLSNCEIVRLSNSLDARCAVRV